jgi:phosphohistidine phosphatase
MRLFVMRHGIAEDRELWHGPDEARPLTFKGMEKTRLAARGLAHLEIRPEVVASSPLIRARQTADIVGEELHITSRVAIWPALEEAGFQSLCANLNRTGEQSTLIVGHEPGLSRFVAQLLTGAADGFAMQFKKAAVCALDVDFSAAEPGATLLWFLTPQQLRALGG